MSLLNKLKTALAAVAVTASMSVSDVSAGTLSLYDGTYEATSVNTRGNLHTIWLPGIFGSGDAYWQFINNSGRLTADGNAGKIKVGGTIENNGTANTALDYRFGVDLNFAYRAPSSGDTANPLRLPKTGGGPLNNTWEFYDMTSATLTGLGDLMGLTLQLTQYRDIDQAFQIGNDANDKNTGLGASVWFRWVAQIDPNKYSGGPAVFNSGTSPAGQHGDLNLNLAPVLITVETVPLPAAGWMLIAGIAGLGAMRRRQRLS